MKLQDELAQILTDGLTGFTVLDYPATIDAPTGPTVCFWPASLTYHPDLPGDVYEVAYTVEILTRAEDPKLAEADLAMSLLAVLRVLWGHDDYLVTKADRTVSEDRKVHAWTLTVTGGLDHPLEATP